MKSKMLLTTVGVACFSLLLGGCGSDKDAASSSSSTSAAPETEMTDDMKESADAVVESAEEMSDEADSKGEDVVADTVESGQTEVDDAMKGVQD